MGYLNVVLLRTEYSRIQLHTAENGLYKKDTQRKQHVSHKTVQISNIQEMRVKYENVDKGLQNNKPVCNGI